MAPFGTQRDGERIWNIGRRLSLNDDICVSVVVIANLVIVTEGYERWDDDYDKVILLIGCK